MRVLHVSVGLLVLSLALLVPAVAIGDTAEGASIDRIEAWQAPANETAFDDSAEVRSAIRDGSLSRATGVTPREMLVVEMDLPGFGETIASANGTNATERFQTALSEHGSLELVQARPSPSRQPFEIDALNGTGVTVYPDAANETYYVAIDIGEANITRGDQLIDLYPDRAHQLDIRAELAADSPVTDSREVAGTAAAPRSADIETAADGKLHFRTQRNQTVSGTTNLGTGSTVTLVLAGDDDPETDTNDSFRRTRTVTVGGLEDSFGYGGHLAGTFDLADAPSTATNVTLDVRSENGSLLEAPIPVVVADPRASIAVQTVETDPVAGVNVSGALSAGGFLVLHEESADGPVVGHTQYLERGHHTVTVYLNRPTDADELVVVSYFDANHNEWFDGPAVETSYADGVPQDNVSFVGVPTGNDTSGNSQSSNGTGTSTPGSNGTSTPGSNGTSTPGTDETPGGGNGSSPDGTDTPDDPAAPGDSSIGDRALPIAGVVVFAILLLAVAQIRTE